MSYANNIVNGNATRQRRTRIKRRFIKAYGPRGSGNIFNLTGKQARRYARALRGADMAEFGQVFS